MHHHSWLIVVFLVELGFHHAGQAGLNLTSNDPPASASESPGIIGMSHHARPLIYFLLNTYLVLDLLNPTVNLC